jgi:hypothetical protein
MPLICNQKNSFALFLCVIAAQMGFTKSLPKERLALLAAGYHPK